ncbi:hypothetical protein BJ138DRAFT_1153834 [Hygrophoropsis aurantiaca]|uniref:Uncharacterized protein n=1 Tax=Hygrophoropsis aurantiaca TaxID=72124 RepID=A0ACB8A9W6_9AGAM|nr:hypothetical protein BJ138DRAFT_1153834 [Hygrophoropsis aurantiaca]
MLNQQLETMLLTLKSTGSVSLHIIFATHPSTRKVELPMVMEDPFHKHESLYLSDGNIAISAPRASGGEMVFRVHQSMLAMHSKIFADMFSLPQSDEAEKYDGVPLVRLSDDSEGFEGVLKAMYHHQCA